MQDMPVYKVLAGLFAEEGVDTVFALLGDANMHWAIALAEEHGVHIIHARHENSACAMADGYARATGRVGVATTTCGPGYTNLLTALTAAVRHRSPLVVFAGDTPMSGAFHGQWLDQRPFAEAAGARFMALRDAGRIAADVRDAFYYARHEGRPVVLSAPIDLQSRMLTESPGYVASRRILPRPQRPQPDPAVVAEAVRRIGAARRPIIIGGYGVVRSQAQDELHRLGDATGALLATTLRAKGLFDGHPFHIGIAGGYATDVARHAFGEADLVIGVGAALGHWTTDAGTLFPNASTIQIDIEPRGLWEGVRVADLHIQADAKAALSAIYSAMALPGGAAPRSGFRAQALAEAIAADLPDPRKWPVEPGVLDPRAALLEIDAAVPKDFDVVVGNAHFTFIAMSHLQGRAPERYFTINGFGAIGHALPAAAGVAAARGDGKVLLIEGDGSLLMTIQDLETIARQDIKLLICVINDGGYGAEIHRLRPKGLNAGHTIFGRPHFAAMARAVGLRGETVNSLGDFDRLFAEHQRSGRSTLWDIHVSNKIPARTFRRLYYGEA